MLSLRSEAGLPPRLLELCRVRIAQIHDCAAELMIADETASLSDDDKTRLAAADFSGFDEAEQAALALAEQMPFAHHAMTDADVARADAALGHPGCVALLTALAFYDVTCRLKLALGFDALAEPVGAQDALR